MKTKYGDFIIRKCTRDNTCYKCDDPDCRKVGDIEHDCMRPNCVNGYINSGIQCHTCEWNANNMKGGAE